MTVIWTGMVVLSILCGLATGRGPAVASAAVEGASAAVELALSIAGMLCLWTGVMEVMRQSGLADQLSRLLSPILRQLFPQAARDRGVAVHKGIVLTQALFYPGFLESTVKLYAKAGVKAMENEVASLLVVSSLHGVKAGAVLAVDAPAFELVGVDGYSQTVDGADVAQAVENEIDIALDALVRIPLD